MADLAREFRDGKTNMTDATGLTSRYDFKLAWAGSVDPGNPESTPESTDLPDIFSALQSQLGLKLERSKTPAEVMVVDHIEKTPTRN